MNRSVMRLARAVVVGVTLGGLATLAGAPRAAVAAAPSRHLAAPHRAMGARSLHRDVFIGGTEVPDDRIDMVNPHDGYALDSLPALNNGGFASSPSLLLSTTDGGATWKEQAFPAGLTMDDIAFPSPRSGWAVGFDQGTGGVAILHTVDGGHTWTHQALPPTLGSATLNAVTFVDPLHGWVVGQSQNSFPFTALVLETADGGTSWTVASLPSTAANSSLSDVAFSDASTGWAVGGSQGPPATILGTTDGGATWSVDAVPSGVTELLSVTARGNDAWAAGVSGSAGVLISSQGGGAWQAETTPASTGLTGVSFASTTTGWATGVGTSGSPLVLRTGDGGSTWTSKPVSGLATASDVAATSGAVARVVGGGACSSALHVVATADRGHTWTAQLAMTGTTAGFNALTFPNTGDGWTIADNCGDGLLHTTNAGGTWTPLATPLPMRQASDVVFTDVNHGWVLGDNQAGSVVAATHDGGASWTTAPLPAGFQFAGGQGTMAFSGTHGWVIGFDSNFNDAIAGTADGGTTWTSETVPTGFFLNTIAAVSPSDVWAAGSGSSGGSVVLASTDAGATWQQQSLPSDQGSVQSLVFASPLQGWAGGSDTSGNASILTTADGGATWVHQSVPAVTSAVQSISFAGTQRGWAIAGSALLTTADGGGSWSQATGPSGLAFGDAIAAVGASSVVLVGTAPYEVPIIEHSANNGATWSPAAVFDPAWITLNPGSGPPGSSTTVDGYGFDPGEHVTIRWQSPQGAVLASVTADSTGAISPLVSIPAAPPGEDRIYAVGQLSLSAPWLPFTVT